MNKKFKKVLLSLACLGMGVPAFAEGTPVYETTITNTQTALEAALTSLAGPVSALVVAGIAIWLIPRVVGILKSAFTAGKGR